MPNRTDQSPPPPIPVADDANATPAQLLNHAAIDYANAQAVTREHQTQGGTGVRMNLPRAPISRVMRSLKPGDDQIGRAHV